MKRIILLLTLLLSLLSSNIAGAAMPACVWVADLTGTARLLDLATAQELTTIPNFTSSRAAMLDDTCGLWAVAGDGVTLNQYAPDGSLTATENLTTTLTRRKTIQQLLLTRHPVEGYRITLHDGVKLISREAGATAFAVVADATTPLAVATAADVGAVGAGYWQLTSKALTYFRESGAEVGAYSLSGQIATPTQMIVDPLRNHAWIGGADGLLIFDLGSGQVLRKIVLTKAVEAMAWDNRNGILWARTLQSVSSGKQKTYTYAVTAYALDGTSPGTLTVATASSTEAPGFAVLPSTSQLAVGTPNGLKLYNLQGELQASYLNGQITLLATPSLVPKPQADITFPSGTTRAVDFEVQVQTRCADDDCLLPADRLAAREAAYAIATSEITAGTLCNVPLTRNTSTYAGTWPSGCTIADGTVTYHVILNGRPLSGFEPNPGLYRLALTQAFTRDTTAPVISNIVPADGSVVKGENPTAQLSGQTNDTNSITVLEQSDTLQAQGPNPQSGMSFNWSITLKPGQNIAALTSLDPAGNGSSAQTTVTYIPTGTATWRFSVAMEEWLNVSAKWIGQGTPATAVYRVQHADGVAVMSMTPSGSGSGNIALGTYRFLPGVTYAVILDSVEGSGTTVADSVSVAAQETGYNIFADHLGTPRVITDNAGQEVWRWEMDDPYGSNPTTGSLEMPLRFTGQIQDQETGLHYNFYRDYDPVMGRYIESDPIGLEGGINTYAYVGGNPLTGFDPLGLANSGSKPSSNLSKLRMPPDPLPILIETYEEMQQKDVPYSDQFFHCLATCRAKKNGSTAPVIKSYMDAKEASDYARNLFGEYGRRKRLSHDEMIEDMRKDKEVNDYGASCPDKESCEQRCQPYIDAMPPKYQPYMDEYLPK